MGLFPPNKFGKLRDPIRQKWVAATPEEIVRQRFIAFLIKDRQFPREGMSVEKKLSELPHLRWRGEKLPERRLDLICFGPKLAFPLLLVECKAVPLKEKMLAQVWGYNAYVRAPFVALVNEKEMRLEWGGKGEDCDFKSIPTYRELIARCREHVGTL